MKINILKKLNIRDNIFSLALLFVVFILPSQVFGATITWDGGGGDNKWSTCTNWTTDTCPGSSDVATFDSTSNTASNVDSSFAGTVGGVNITTGYTNTITLQKNLTVGTSDFTQSTGTFNMSSFTMIMSNTSADVVLSGGTFNAGTGTLQMGVGGADGSHVINVPTTQTFYNLTINVNSVSNIDISGDTIVVSNTYTQTSGALNNGTLNWQGTTASQGASASGGTAVFNFASTTAAQTYTVNGGTGPLLTLDSADDASDSLVFNANGAFYGINITSGFSGTFAPTYNGFGLTIGIAKFIQAAGTFNSPPSLTLVGSYFVTSGITITGGTLANSSTTDLVIGDGVNGSSAIDVPSLITFKSLNIYCYSAGGYGLDLSGDTLVIKDTVNLTQGFINNGTIFWYGTSTVQSSLAYAGSAVFNFASTSASQTYTVNGGTGPLIKLDSSDDASDSIVFNANAGFYGMNITSGFSGTVPTVFNGYSMEIGLGSFIQDAGTFWAPTSMTVDSGGFGGNNFLVIRNSAAFNSSTSTLVMGNLVGQSTLYASSTPTVNNFTVNSHSIYPVSLSSGSIIANNAFNQTSGLINSGTVYVKGNVTIGTSAGGGSADLYFTGSSNQTYTDSGGNELDGDIYIDKTAGTVTLATNADWNASGQDLIINNGIIDQGASYNISTNAVNINGYGSKWTNSGTGDITLASDVTNNGYVIFDGSGGGCGSADSIAISSSSGGTKRTWYGNGISQIYDVSVTDMATTSTTVYSSTNTSGNTWTFTSACPTTFTQNDYRWYDNADSLSPGSATAALNTAPSIDGSSPLRLRVNNTLGTADLSASAQTFAIEYSTTTSGPWRELSPDAWWNTSWLNRKMILLNGKEISSNLTNFPILVKLNSSNIDYSKTKNAGEDIRFVDPDGTSLSYEIEEWNESGDSLVWVKIPQLNSGVFNDYIMMYYNNTSATDGQNASSVWSNGYAGVWHMKGDPGGSAPQILDSTSNANNGTSNGSMTSTNKVTGMVGYATNFDGVDDYIDVGTGASINLTGTSATVSMWTKNNVNPAQFDVLFSKVTNTSWLAGYGMFYNSASTINFFVNSYTGNVATANIVPTSWNYVSGVYDGTNVLMYVNGTAGTSDTFSGSITSGALSGRISQGGSNTYNVNGIIDELRISNVARSADWVKAEYFSIQNGIAKIGKEEATDDFVIFKNNASVSNATTLGSNLLASSDISGSYNENNSSITNPNSATNGQEVEWDFPIDALNAPKEDVYFRFVKRNGIDLETYTRYPRLDINALINHQTYRWYDNTDAIQPTVSVASEGARANFNGTKPNARLRVNLSATLNALPANKQSFKLQYTTNTGGTWYDIGATWYNASWLNRKKITLNNTASAENLTNFPILVSLTSSNIDYSKTKNAGEDIRFVDSDGTLLSYEIEKWDETATSTVWVKIPQIDAGSSTDYIYVYYNNTGASDAQSATSVWDSSYKGIWHLPNGSVLTANDSTGVNNGTLNNSPTATTTYLGNGGAAFVSASSQSISLGTNASLNPSAITVSAWVKANSFPNSYNTVVSKIASLSAFNQLFVKSTGKLAVYVVGSGSVNYDGTGSNTLIAGNWYHLSFTYDSTGGIKGYVNGALDGSASANGSLASNSGNTTIANDTFTAGRFWNGAIEEVRISNTARSADWIEAEYINMNGSMNSYGSEESAPAWAFYDNATPTNGANISSNLLSTSDKTESYVESNPTPTNPNTINKNQKGEWDFSLNAANTVDDTVYYFRIVKSDGSLINSYSSYPEVTINRVVAVSWGGSGASVELGSGGGTPVGGGTDNGGSDGGDGSGGGAPSGGGSSGGGGGQSP